MARKWIGTWQGGRTFENRHGQTGWVLIRMVDGERFSKTLHVTSEEDALAELALFDRDPGKYVTPGEQARDAGVGAIIVGAETTAQVQAHLKKKGRGIDYIDDVLLYLATWAEDLDGRDLRTLRTGDLKRMLDKHHSARQKRIAAIKTFTSYFRTEVNTLAAHEDPTITLMSLQTTAEQLRRPKGYELADVERVYASIYDWESERTKTDRFGRNRPRGCIATRRKSWGDLQGVRDVLVLLLKYGMHMTEIDRVSSGKGDITVLEGNGLIAATLRYLHKKGTYHTISLDAQGLAATQRLQSHGEPISHSFVWSTLKFASVRAGLSKTLAPGELRHTFVTQATSRGVEVKPKTGGVSMDRVVAVTGHSEKTARTYYLGQHVPSMIQIPVQLVHPDDPKPAAAKKRSARRKLKLVSAA